jgi:hypothetical protein
MRMFYRASVNTCESGVRQNLTNGNEYRKERLTKTTKGAVVSGYALKAYSRRRSTALLIHNFDVR